MNRANSPDYAEKIVWDKFIVFFHWTLALAFAISYITGENDWQQDVHTYSGYYITIIVMLRIIWGFVGNKHARFKDFIFSPIEILRYSKGLFNLKPTQYLGHNPLGGLMVFALIIMLVINVISGMALLGGEEFEGPFGFLGYQLTEGQLEIIEEIHETAPSLTLILVFIHIGGVLVDMFLHRHNLIKSMITGKKKIEQ